MSFLRCDNASVGPAVPAATRLGVMLALCSLGAAAQTSFTSSASPQPLTATEISQYLVARDKRPIVREAKTSETAPSAESIVAKMMATSAYRSADLQGFQGKRWYHLQYHGFLGGREASMEVLASYSAPDKREYTVISQSGSKLLLNRVLLKLLDSERQAFANRKKIDLSPDNYTFELLGTDHGDDGTNCYVLSVKPRKSNEFLYKGKIWVNSNDFAVVRMEGEPVKSPSFWIKDTQIQSKWRKVGAFWFIAHNQSISHIRMGGTATLNIDYGDYQITSVDHHTSSRATEKAQAQSPVLPDPSTITPQR
ncbi:MAG TPA: hypothetical protein VJ731_09670 [Terriglobales bacterium]|nr:hypothetical protein [Terriglobales bacterium]